MELEPNKNEGQIRQSERLVSQLPESTQQVLNVIVQKIVDTKEKQSLSFTLSTGDAHLVLELLDADSNLERLGRT